MRRMIRQLVRIETVAVLVLAWLAGALGLGLASGAGAVPTVALMALGLLLDRLPLRALRAAGWLLFAGVLLFSGSLYLLLAGAPRMLGVLTPIGGLALIAAWCVAAIALGSGKIAGGNA